MDTGYFNLPLTACFNMLFSNWQSVCMITLPKQLYIQDIFHAHDKGEINQFEPYRVAQFVMTCKLPAKE